MAKVRPVELIDRDLARAKLRIRELSAERRLSVVRLMQHALVASETATAGEKPSSQPECDETEGPANAH
jgi:hypothetical protein